MTVYHIVLLKQKPGVTAEQLESFSKLVHAMVGQVPGLQSASVGPPLPSTAHRGKGYDYGLVTVLDKPDDVAVYANHPAHLKVAGLRVELFDDALAYDLVF